MRVRDITEASLENIGVLQDMVKLIMTHWPETIPANSEYVIGRDPEARLSPEQGNQPIKGIDPLIQKYEDYPKIVDGLEKFKDSWIVLDNTEDAIGAGYNGLYNWGYITINLAGIKGNAEAVYDYDLYHGVVDRVKVTLAHELRHYFQDRTFQKYMRSPKAHSGDWNQRSVEMDAEWSSVISKYNVGEWSNPSDFADYVIDNWAYEMNVRGDKTIPDKIVAHYRKKTIKYFFQHNQNYVKQTLKDAIKANVYYKNAKDFVNYTLDDFKSYTYNVLTPAAYNLARSNIILYWKNNIKPKLQSKVNTI